MAISDTATTGNGHFEETTSHRLGEVRQAADQVLAKVETFIRERPATALLIAAGAGFVIGRLLRRS